jgi:thermitase
MLSKPRSPRVRKNARPQLEMLDVRALLSVGSVATLAAVFPQPEAAPAALRLLVKFQPGTTATAENSLLATTRTTVLSSFPDGPTIIQTGLGVDPAQALSQLQASSLVVYAEADSTLKLADTTTTLPTVAPSYPTNQKFAQEWGLNNPGNVDIDAPEAWSVTTGSPSTIVAVIDTGIDLTNPQLVSRLWVNAAASTPRHTVFGWNFLNNNGNVQDQNGHGTHVTGVIAATGNNGQGVAGIDWHARIMPLRILDSTGSGSLDAAVSAVYFAAQHGARVINASWGSSAPDLALADAIRYADQKGVVFVNAAGNDGVNNDTVPTYPASYRTPNMLVVAAVDESGNLGSFSNYGPQTVDLAAPGVNILSTYLRRLGGYATLSGTSMSTPFVTGVVSLLAGLHPTWSAEQLVQQVLATTKPLASLAGKTVTGGIVDAAQAVGVAGSGPGGDHYPGPPVVQKSISKHSRPIRKTRIRSTPKTPHPQINRQSLGASTWVVQAHGRSHLAANLPLSGERLPLGGLLELTTRPLLS